jgi:hypothetical protein
MEEHDDVPRQERPDVAFDKPRDCGSEDPFNIVQALDRLKDEDRTFDNPGASHKPPSETRRWAIYQ